MPATNSRGRHSNLSRGLAWEYLFTCVWLLPGGVRPAWSSALARITGGNSHWQLGAVVIIGALAALLYGFLRRVVMRRFQTTRTSTPTSPAAVTALNHGYGSLSIYRAPAYADKFRKYTVILDGMAVGEVLPEETCTVSAPEGTHIVKIKIDWAESNPLTIAVSSRSPQRLTVRSNLRGLRVAFALWYVAFSSKSYLRLERSDA